LIAGLVPTWAAACISGAPAAMVAFWKNSRRFMLKYYSNRRSDTAPVAPEIDMQTRGVAIAVVLAGFDDPQPALLKQFSGCTFRHEQHFVRIGAEVRNDSLYFFDVGRVGDDEL